MHMAGQYLARDVFASILLISSSPARLTECPDLVAWLQTPCRALKKLTYLNLSLEGDDHLDNDDDQGAVGNFFASAAAIQQSITHLSLQDCLLAAKDGQSLHLPHVETLEMFLFRFNLELPFDILQDVLAACPALTSIRIRCLALYESERPPCTISHQSLRHLSLTVGWFFGRTTFFGHTFDFPALESFRLEFTPPISGEESETDSSEESTTSNEDKIRFMLHILNGSRSLKVLELINVDADKGLVAQLCSKDRADGANDVSPAA
jgi:hypothetical protein